jgi:subtilisin family serine protease
MAVVGAALSVVAVAATPAYAAGTHRYMVVAKSSSAYTGLRAEAVASGATVVRGMPQVASFVMDASSTTRDQLAGDARTLGVALDHRESLVNPDGPPTMNSKPGLLGAHGVIVPPEDPAFALEHLLWSIRRIDAPAAWSVTTGSPDVTVGVADTGLDYTHAELSSQVAGVTDFTGSEDPEICKTYFGGFDDADLSAAYGGPANGDWNGHGSWIGGNIAAAVNGTGINGIAPNVKLYALKISQWCGSAYDSEIIAAFLYAADHNIDVVSISFGGYLNRHDRGQNAIWKAYKDAVAYARAHGTVIAASAGNEHARIGHNGLVLSHGTLTIPGQPVTDYYGQYQVPGGIPGVVDVSSTGNVVDPPSASCNPADIGSNATCKPASDAHQSFGVGKKSQLAYYSNYGPRINVAGPGGAREFNLPAADRGGTGGFPYTAASGTQAFEDFSITSNWALEIPCFTFTSPLFPADQCYSTIQGTSMAAPHASAVLALIASANPGLRHHPAALVKRLYQGASTAPDNWTPGLSATDLSNGDLNGLPCSTGYCHLGGAPISDSEAYGHGLVNARLSLGASK